MDSVFYMQTIYNGSSYRKKVPIQKMKQTFYRNITKDFKHTTNSVIDERSYTTNCD